MLQKILYWAVIIGILGLVFGLLSSFSAQSDESDIDVSPRVVVSLGNVHTSYNVGSDIVLHVEISNPNTDSIKILKWFTPIDGLDRPLFTVLHDGEAVSYAGKLVKRPPPSEENYMPISGGESVYVDVVLSDYYDFSIPGDYVVMYETTSNQLYYDGGRLSDKSDSLISNSLVIVVKK